MTGIHVYWTKPFTHTAPKKTDKTSKVDNLITDLNLLLMVLSALQWRQSNGRIKLYTDPPFVAWLSGLGLTDCWDTIDDNVLTTIPDLNHASSSGIDARIFWSAGKIFAFLEEPTPFVSLDIDLIVWCDLSAYWTGDLKFAHWEIVDKEFYGLGKQLATPKNYHFKPIWNSFPHKAANVSLVYFGNQKFKEYYAGEVLRFMRGNSIASQKATTRPELLFAEQRMLFLCAMEKGIDFGSLLNTTYDPESDTFNSLDDAVKEWDYPRLDCSQLFTHTWIYKNYLEKHRSLYERYCLRLLEFIKLANPEIYLRLSEVPILNRFFE